MRNNRKPNCQHGRRCDPGQGCSHMVSMSSSKAGLTSCPCVFKLVWECDAPQHSPGTQPSLKGGAQATGQGLLPGQAGLGLWVPPRIVLPHRRASSGAGERSAPSPASAVAQWPVSAGLAAPLRLEPRPSVSARPASPCPSRPPCQ